MPNTTAYLHRPTQSHKLLPVHAPRPVLGQSAVSIHSQAVFWQTNLKVRSYKWLRQLARTVSEGHSPHSNMRDLTANGWEVSTVHPYARRCCGRCCFCRGALDAGNEMPCQLCRRASIQAHIILVPAQLHRAFQGQSCGRLWCAASKSPPLQEKGIALALKLC